VVFGPIGVFGPVGAMVFTDNGEIWHGIVPWVHSFVPNLALIGKGVDTGAPEFENLVNWL